MAMHHISGWTALAPACLPAMAVQPVVRKACQKQRMQLRSTAYRPSSKVLVRSLSRWGDRDGREGDTEEGKDDDGFDKDTQKLALRLLTARSVQRMMMQLQETDIRLYSWLSDFCSATNPMDDQFLQKLLRAPPATISDNISKKEREISPSDLADRLIIVRHSMAKGIMGGMPKYVADANLAVYRKHVESGLLMEKPKYRRK